MARTISIWLVAFLSFVNAARAQEPNVINDVQLGHRLAMQICSYCHIATPEQQFQPIMQPPAPSFESIAQRKDISTDFIRTFLATTHRDISNPRGMPNPELLDFQAKQIAAYVLSLRRKP